MSRKIFLTQFFNFLNWELTQPIKNIHCSRPYSKLVWCCPAQLSLMTLKLRRFCHINSQVLTSILVTTEVKAATTMRNYLITLKMQIPLYVHYSSFLLAQFSSMSNQRVLMKIGAGWGGGHIFQCLYMFLTDLETIWMPHELTAICRHCHRRWNSCGIIGLRYSREPN